MLRSKTSLLPPRPVQHKPDTSLAIVNIVLLLLFFFLTTGTLASGPDTQVHLPATQEMPSGHLPTPILEVGDGGILRLDGAVISLPDLSDAFSTGQILHVLMDGTAPALDLLELLARPEFSDLDIRLVTRHRRVGA